VPIGEYSPESWARHLIAAGNEPSPQGLENLLRDFHSAKRLDDELRSKGRLRQG
jgi:hypothetical protein